MSKKKQKKEIGPIEYWPTNFPVWAAEALSVVQYCKGAGVDVGCGRRSLTKEVVRVDIDPDVEPDHVADAIDLPFEDDTFDFMWASHVIEHTEEPLATIREARRVVKPGGFLVYIIPNKKYTEGLDPTHKHEWTPDEYAKEYGLLEDEGLQLVSFGVAAKGWSFRAVYQVLPAGEECPDCRQKAVEALEAGLQDFAPRSMRRDPLRVSAILDHPALTTGLACVGRKILEGFQRELFRVSVLGTMHTVPVRPGQFPYYVESVCRHDFYGYGAGLSFLERMGTEVLFTLGDPGTIVQRLQAMFMLGTPIPIVAYFPVEGAPLLPAFLEMIKIIQNSGGAAITYTEWGAKQIEQQSGGELRVPWVWHGVDHAPFRPYPPEEQERLRRLIGWQDRFVVMNVSRNKRTNRHAAYIEAAAILKDWGYTDILFYLHCDPQDELAIQGMGGLDLLHLVEYHDVKDMVVFPPKFGDQLHGIPYHQLRRADWEGLVPPDNAEGRGALMASFSLIDRYNCADLYVDASSVQGFNLPNIEAMACGLPVLATKDNGVRCEVLGDAPFAFLESSVDDYWHTGATLKLVAPEVIAWHVADALKATDKDIAQEAAKL